MNNVARTPLLALFLVSTSYIAGCASSGDAGFPTNDTPVDGTPPVEGSPDPTTSPLPPGDIDNPSTPVGTEVDRGETVNKDLADAVDTIKGRNSILPQRGVFFSVGIRNLERTPEAGDERTGSDSDITNLSIGYDQIVSDSWVVGTLVDVSRTDESSSVQDEFSISGNSLSVFLFSSLALSESFDLSAYAGYSRADTSSTRFTTSGNITIVDPDLDLNQQIDILAGQVQGDSNSDVFSAGLSVAHRSDFGAGNQFTARADADVINNTTFAFTEQGETNSELFFNEITRNNMKFTLSGAISRYISRPAGVFVPTLTLAAVFDEPDDSSNTAIPVLSPGFLIDIDAAAFDRNYGTVDFDLLWVRPTGLQLFGNLNSNFGNDIEKAIGANVGARLEF